MSISSRSARPSAFSFLLVVVLLMRLQRGEAAESLRERVGDADEEGLASAFAACITHVRLLEPGVEDALKSDALEEALEPLEPIPAHGRTGFARRATLTAGNEV